MGYSADTFSAGEQPTTAKWNKLWANDASFNDGSGIGNNAISARSLATNAIKLGSAVVTSGQNVTTSESTMVSLTITIPAGGRDLLLIAEHSHQTGSGAGDDGTWYSIKETSTFLNRKRARTFASIDNIGTTLFAIVAAPSAGSHTYTYTAVNDVRTSVMQADTTYPVSLVALLI